MTINALNTQPALSRLNPQQLEEFGKAMDDIRDRAMADVGERDAKYIRGIVRLQRRLEIGGRALLMASIFPPAWVAGVAALGAAKILDNMEIGHNVMHGQYDWMNDPALSSRNFDWDTACPGEQWQHSHNYMHHTYTNVQEVDRDIGYGILRMSDEQKWHPYFLLNPLWALLLAMFFQYGVALHDIEVEKINTGKKKWSDAWGLLKGIGRKTGGQTLKDYVLFPLLAGPFFVPVILGNATANLIRNLWAYTIIFCGHFPDGVEQFHKSVLENETRGHWYLRQLRGSANLTGGKWFHIFSGNLSHQIEHHLFPTVPAHRYAEMSVEVQALCEKYGLEYNKGPLTKQFGTVVRRIFRLSLPSQAPNSLPAAA